MLQPAALESPGGFLLNKTLVTGNTLAPPRACRAMKTTPIAALFFAGLCACDNGPARDSDPAGMDVAIGAPSSATPAPTATTAKAVPLDPPPPGASLITAEWRKADNRATCAPLAFGPAADKGGIPRRAFFGGGWAVAFDLPERRSAYGIAGAGVLTKSRAELSEQWPYTATPPRLPAGSFAGYGISGAESYPFDIPKGEGLNSGAYVRVEGQGCLYNLWSWLGRDHLEEMISTLEELSREP